MAGEKDCPQCGNTLNVVLFMGVQPDFYSCPVCQIAFSLDDLKPLARVIADAPSKELIILRGLPGSGKSTIAKQILNGSKDAIICSSDDYFMEDGKYVFRQGELKQSHGACQMSADRAMANGIKTVIIDNTNIKKEHMRPYQDMARKYGYKVTIRTIGSMEKKDIDKYLTRQVHAVPQEKIEQMAQEFEP